MSLVGLEEAVARAQSILRAGRYVVAFTGAGISTPSGIPDFRSKGSGMWERYNPMETASLTTFRHDHQRFWDWKRPLMLNSWQAQPNPAHQTLSALEAKGILKAVITQNIDGLHQRAGSKTVLEVHGSIETMTCLRCKNHFISRDFRTVLEQPGGIPTCPNDGAILKPDVVLFEEALPQDVWLQAQAHAQSADVLLIVGSSLEVYPAAYLPEMAVENGAKTIIANLSSTFLDSQAEVLLPADVALSLPAIAIGLV
jgi:NAD-dependent deacetylase